MILARYGFYEEASSAIPLDLKLSQAEAVKLNLSSYSFIAQLKVLTLASFCA